SGEVGAESTARASRRPGGEIANDGVALATGLRGARRRRGRAVVSSAMAIFVLTIDGVFDLGLSAVLDTFSTAHALAERAASRPAVELAARVIGLRRSVRTAQGMRVPVETDARVGRGDLVVVPALGAKAPDELGAA